MEDLQVHLTYPLYFKSSRKLHELSTLSKEKVIDLMTQYDSNVDGSIDWDEFKQKIDKDSDGEGLFAKLDTNQDKKITPNEIDKDFS